LCAGRDGGERQTRGTELWAEAAPKHTQRRPVGPKTKETVRANVYNKLKGNPPLLCGDGDLLLLAGALVLGGDVQDAVGVHLKRHLNLGGGWVGGWVGVGCLCDGGVCWCVCVCVCVGARARR